MIVTCLDLSVFIGEGYDCVGVEEAKMVIIVGFGVFLVHNDKRKFVYSLAHQYVYMVPIYKKILYKIIDTCISLDRSFL